MKLLFVYQGFQEAHALGAKVRRSGIRKAFDSRGFQCSDIELSRRRLAPAEIFSLSGMMPARRAELLALAQENDVIFLEGLPTAVATIRGLRKSANKVIHVDICDSWMRLSNVGGGAGDSTKAKTARRLKRILAGTALRYVSRYADSVSYISDLDLSEDGDYLRDNTKAFVVTNGSPLGSYSGVVEWNKRGPMVVVGDWSYLPNKEMLDVILAWYAGLSSTNFWTGLNIFGPNLAEKYKLPESVAAIGWVEDICLAYKNASCALALTTSGSGIKNKVLEPLSYGIPVIATEDALIGIPYDPSMVLKFRDDLTADDVQSWLGHLANNGVTKMNTPTWEQNIEKLVIHILNGSGS